MILAAVVLLILLIILGLPLFIGIFAASMLGLYVSQVQLMAIPIDIFRLANAPILLAIPLFT
jgi:C4-dicarboxylate transporter DctM subunit